MLVIRILLRIGKDNAFFTEEAKIKGETCTDIQRISVNGDFYNKSTLNEFSNVNLIPFSIPKAVSD